MSNDLRQKYKVAVIGAGYVATHHLAALAKLDFIEVVGIADVNLIAAKKMAEQFGLPVACAQAAELLALKPDIVFVLTPPSSHCALSLQAMEFGCHVLVEKPMAESVQECDLMIAMAKQKGVTLSVNHSDKLDPVVIKAIELVKAGVCGEILAVDNLRSSEYPPYAGGPLPKMVSQGSYPFRDLGVHGLYLLEAFLGNIERLSVDFRSTGHHSNLAFDEWFATAECSKGVGRLQLSWNVRPMQSRLIVQGTKAVIEIDRFLQICRVTRVYPGPKFIGIVLAAFFNSLRNVFRIPANVFAFATGRLRPSPGIRRGAEAFVMAIRDGLPPPISPEEGRHIIELMESACDKADQARGQQLQGRFGELPPADTLVTGAAGVLGSALVNRLLAEGQSVRVLVRRSLNAAQSGAGVQVVLGDLGDPEIVEHAVKGIKTVYHVGAAMKGGPADFECGTVWGTKNILAACEKHGVKRVVYVSSMSVLDHAGRDKNITLSERATLEPHPELRGAYTQTKLKAELMVLDAIHERGLDAVIVRPGQIVAKGAERSTPNATIGLAGRWIRVGSGNQTLPAIYVDDVVDAIRLAAGLVAPNERLFNLVDPVTITHDEYISYARKKLGSELRLIALPVPIALLLAFAAETLGKVLGRSVPLTRYRIRSLRPLANFDLSAATKVLGWQPRVGIREGLQRTFQ